MNDTRTELIKELREIWDNKDFVCGAISNAGTEDAWEEMYDYIMGKKKSRELITSDEILLLSLELSSDNKYNNRDSMVALL